MWGGHQEPDFFLILWAKNVLSCVECTPAHIMEVK